MSDIFDAMHRAFFEKLFSLDAEGREAKAQLLREAGVSEEMIGQNAGHVLLRVKRPPFDEGGHIEIEVLEVGPPSEESHQAGGQTDGEA
jgi:hypothetical protein